MDNISQDVYDELGWGTIDARNPPSRALYNILQKNYGSVNNALLQCLTPFDDHGKTAPTVHFVAAGHNIIAFQRFVSRTAGPCSFCHPSKSPFININSFLRCASCVA